MKQMVVVRCVTGQCHWRLWARCTSDIRWRWASVAALLPGAAFRFGAVRPGRLMPQSLSSTNNRSRGSSEAGLDGSGTPGRRHHAHNILDECSCCIIVYNNFTNLPDALGRTRSGGSMLAQFTGGREDRVNEIICHIIEHTVDRLNGVGTCFPIRVPTLCTYVPKNKYYIRTYTDL